MGHDNFWRGLILSSGRQGSGWGSKTAAGVFLTMFVCRVALGGCETVLPKEIKPNGLIRTLTEQVFTIVRREEEKCDLRIMSAGNEAEQKKIVGKFEKEVEAKRVKCTVLVVSNTGAPNEWIIAGFNAAGKFKIVVIDDTKVGLSKELKKELTNKRKTPELDTSSLSRGKQKNRPEQVHVQAQEIKPDRLIKAITEQVFAIVRGEDEIQLERAYKLVANQLSPHIDFDRASRRVLGRYWGKITPHQRTHFTNEFSTLMLRFYTQAVINNQDVDIDYLPVVKGRSPNYVKVRTKVKRKSGSPIGVDYRMHKKNGDWKVYDIMFDGISLTKSRRNQFGIEIRQGGVEKLIDKLAAKNGASRGH